MQTAAMAIALASARGWSSSRQRKRNETNGWFPQDRAATPNADLRRE
jgi:hypothetical protein